MEELIALANEHSPDGKITVITDRNGFSYRKNMNIKFNRKFIPVFEKFYPERIFRIYLLNPEYLISIPLKIAKKLVDPRTM